MNKYNKIGFVNGSAPALNADNLNHMDEGIERATDGAIALETEIATARGDSADLNTRFISGEASIEAVKSEIATARGSYDNLDQRFNDLIVDDEGVISTFNLADGAVTTAIIEDGAVTQNKLSADLKSAVNSIANKADTADVNAALALKANKATTLDGYGITDAYTQSEIKTKLDQKLKKMPFDSEPKQESPCYLTSGAVYNALLAKADKSTTLAGYGITDAYTKERTDQKLARKLDSMPFDNEPKQNSPCYLTSGTVYNALLTKADKTETDNSLAEKADKVDVDTSLANKANLVSSSNIFDFDAWAKELQKINPPVFHGTLDELNFDEKSITITTTEKDTYTNGWQLNYAEVMKISVKPNTKYLICWLTNDNSSNAFVFLNGITTNNVAMKGGKGTFVTNNDTSFITLRFGTYSNSTFKVSKIMITEKESIYLPNIVAEGVTEVANEVLTFEKTTQTSLDGKYDSSNVEVGTATLTPYSTQIDKIKSATCLYEKIGDIVIVNVTVIMNATSLDGTSSISLLNMPFSNKSDVIVHDIGISKNGGMFRVSVTKSAWLQFTPLNKQAYNFVADEQVNFSLIYKI